MKLLQPDFTSEQGLRAMRQQLAELRKIKALPKDQTTYKEHEGWVQTTRSFIIQSFYPAGGVALGNFDSASYAKRYRNQYEDFLAVSDKQETVLLGLVKELEFVLPQAEPQGVYAAGDEFAFYKDLKDIIAAATKSVFVVDNYLGNEVFELYLHPVQAGIDIRVLTATEQMLKNQQAKGNLLAVATKYSTRKNFEFRSSKEVHDRHVFLDGFRGWIIGQSLKDAARRKPTYMVELDAGSVPATQGIYDDIWKRAVVVLKT